MATSAPKQRTEIDADARTWVLTHRKSTKGTEVYADDNGHQIYVPKDDLKQEGKSGFPQKIVFHLTLNW